LQLPSSLKSFHLRNVQGSGCAWLNRGKRPLLIACSITQQQPSRAEIETLVEDLIDRLNEMHFGADLEAHGEELDGTSAEDAFALLGGPGRLWAPAARSATRMLLVPSAGMVFPEPLPPQGIPAFNHCAA
jgi:hypothetical protein